MRWAVPIFFLLAMTFGPGVVPSQAMQQPSTIETDTTWRLAESPVVLEQDLSVNPGATLSIEPGVEVRLARAVSLIVRGALHAEGTAAAPIRFVSHEPAPAPGDWGHIDIRGESTFTVLRHVVIEHGGHPGRAGQGCAPGALCANGAHVTLDASTVRGSATNGVVLLQSDATISGGRFVDNAESGIRLHRCDLRVGPCKPTLLGNSFSGNGRPISRHGFHDPVLSGNEAASNTINGYVLESCAYSGDAFWRADLPYVVPLWCDLGGYGPANLAIGPGVVVKFASGGLSLKANARLSTFGTPEQPVVFTSLKDDDAGGDTNGDGDASFPAPNDFDGIKVTGAQAEASFLGSVFRYGGSSMLGRGPTVLADGEGRIELRQCDIGHSETGVRAWRGGHVALHDSHVHDTSFAGVMASSSGEVLIADNRFASNATGVLVEEGAAELRGNVFANNVLGVEVTCRGPGCGPRVTPGNHFRSSVQQAILVHHPLEECVPAHANFWGSKSGPRDRSSAPDACDLPDHPGTGTAVSDGVDYLPWAGGMSRPILTQPRCGTTARAAPAFAGYGQAGAALSFYDGDTSLGGTSVRPDGTFAWTPDAPLADGQHRITAVSADGDATSLPSRVLTLTVDTSLPFDPQGVRLRYELHGSTVTQRMRDADGCVSATGDIRTPLSVRPGSDVTVQVPFRDDGATGSTRREALAPANIRRLGAHGPRSWPTSGHRLNAVRQTRRVTYTVQNDTAHTLTHFRVDQYQFLPGIYGRSRPLPRVLEPGGSVVIELDAPVDHDPTTAVYANLLLETVPGQAVARLDELREGTPGVLVPGAQGQPADVWIENETGRPVKDVRILRDVTLGSRHRGGSYVSEDQPLANFGVLRLVTPGGARGTLWVELRTTDGVLHHRKLALGPMGVPNEISLLESRKGEELTVRNRSARTICHLYLHRHKKGQSPTQADLDDGLPLRIGTIDTDGKRTLALERGNDTYRYTLAAFDCSNKLVDVRRDLLLDGTTEWTISDIECEPPAKLQLRPASPGETIERLFERLTSPLQSQDGDGFALYAASVPAVAGQMRMLVCVRDEGEREVPLGSQLIDPDGYVYDEAAGIDHVIENATVTCDVFDEDYRSWARWPAEAYEAQINPQVTGPDGYYAFFVPPGLYRVRASASGYAPHTSPDIRVISEVVHYNIPLRKPILYLPRLRRP